MSETLCAALMVLTCLLTLSKAGTDVSCVFEQSCVLPCSFQNADDVVIHWIKTAENIHIHSYYYNQDQFANQDQNFRGRTSLFKDQISKGNASLQLTEVRVQDQGRYKCYTSTRSRETFINLQVDAPVSHIHIEQVGNRIICRSEGIYPEPELTWSTNPPSTFKNTSGVQPTEQKLYNISGSLILSHNVTVDYSCRISTRSNTRTATLFKPAPISVTGSEASVPCTSPNASFSSLIWTFNHSQIILNQTGSDTDTVSAEWRPHVQSVSESGDLRLKQLSVQHQGTYSCELTNTQDTFVTNTDLQLLDTSPRLAHAGIISGVVVAVLVIAAGAVILVLYRKYKEVHQQKTIETNQENNQELKCLNETPNQNSEPDS